MRNPPFLVLARIALTQDAAPLLPAARAALEAGDGETAIWLASRALALAPDQRWPYIVLALALEGGAGRELGEPGLERRAYLLDPGNPETLEWLAARLMERPGALATQIRRHRLAIAPAWAETLSHHARARLWAEDPRGAIELARAVRTQPALRDGAYAFGEKLVGEGRIAMAAALFPALAAVAPPPAAMALPMASPADLVAAVKAGASLATVMTPDPFIPNNWPEYLEGYRFDHLIVSETGFWALPPPIDLDPLSGAATAFAYASDSRLFFRYIGVQEPRARLLGAAGTMAKLSHYQSDAYRDFHFLTRHDHTLVYDHARPAEIAALEAAIRSGVPLRLVLDTADGLVHVLPVHLCFLYRESGEVRVLSELRYVPELCLAPMERLWPYFARVIATLDTGPLFALDTGQDDADGNPRYDLVTLAGGVTPKDFPLGTIARKLDTVEAVSRLVISKMVVHSQGRVDSFGPTGEAIQHPFATFQLYARN